MTGRLLRRKGFQHVLSALKGSGHRLRVPHCGRRAHARGTRAACRTGCARRCSSTAGSISNSPELKELYETSAVFCLPSERENASISLLEAMLAGMAVITTDVTGCPETVGDAGIVVPPNDPGALQSALQSLLEAPALCEDHGRKARERVETHFDWEQIGTQYLDCFERILAEKTPA